MALQGVLLRILSQEEFVKNSGYSGHPKTGVLIQEANGNKIRSG